MSSFLCPAYGGSRISDQRRIENDLNQGNQFLKDLNIVFHIRHGTRTQDSMELCCSLSSSVFKSSVFRRSSSNFGTLYVTSLSSLGEIPATFDSAFSRARLKAKCWFLLPASMRLLGVLQFREFVRQPDHTREPTKRVT
jgi:hypothetical protein